MVGGTPHGPACATVHVTCKDRSTDAAMLQRRLTQAPWEPPSSSRAAPACSRPASHCSLTGPTPGKTPTGTVLQQDGSASYILASSAYVDNSTSTGDPLSIRDLTVACDGSGSTDGIILLNWQADVENVDVSDCGGSGIVDTNTNASGGAITNTSVNSRFDNNFITNSGKYGFYVHDTGNSVTDGFLDDNQIATPGLMQFISRMPQDGISQAITSTMSARTPSVRTGYSGQQSPSNYIEDFAAGNNRAPGTASLAPSRMGMAPRSWETRSSTTWASGPAPPMFISASRRPTAAQVIWR